MLLNDVKYYVVRGGVEYGHVLNGVFFEYAFGVELPINIENRKIVQLVSKDMKDFESTVLGIIDEDTVVNRHGAVFKLQAERP